MSAARDAILQLIQGELTMCVLIGTATEIDKDNDTCTITPIDGADHYDAKLRAISDPEFNSRVVIYPKEGSKVVYALINDDPNNTMVVSVSEFESILIEVLTVFKLELKDTGELKIDSDNVIFNDGTNGGIVKSVSTAAEANNIINSLNVFKSLLSSWTPIPNDGGLALKTLITAWASSMLATVVPTDLENNKIKH